MPQLSFDRWTKASLLAIVVLFVAVIGVRASSVILGEQAEQGLDANPGTAVMQDVEASPGLRIVEVKATAFTTTYTFEIDTDEPIADGYVPALEPDDLDLAGQAPDAIAFGTTDDGSAARFTVRTGALPAGTESVAFSLDGYFIIPPEGSGVRVDGPWTADIAIDLTKRPPAASLTPDSPDAWIAESEEGNWRYVIDGIEYDDEIVQVSYHVEGDIDGLASVYSLEYPKDLVPYPENGTTGVHIIDRGVAGEQLSLRFGPALRPAPDPAAVTFAVSDVTDEGATWRDSEWTGHLLPIGDDSAITDIFRSTVSGELYVRVKSELDLRGAGSPGRIATLVDDLGNEYPQFRSGANVPPTESYWGFEGPIAEGASTLTFSLDGYGEYEQPMKRIPLAMD